MIRKIVTVLILVPLALAIVMFAVGEPRAGDDRRSIRSAREPPMFAFAMPLFLLLLLALIAGVIVGGAAAWSRQSKWRRRARRLSADLKAARAEAETLRRRLEASAAAQAQPQRADSIAAIAYRHPVAPRMTCMKIVTADEIDRVLTYPALIEALREAFRADIDGRRCATPT